VSYMSLYPAFARHGRLHLNPEGSRAYLAIPRGERPDGTEVNVGKWATSIVRRMDGEHSLLDLSRIALETRKAAAPGEPPDQTLQHFADLVNGLAERSIVDLADHPLARPVPTTGAPDRQSPTHASVELTDYCNLACKHCYRESSPACSNFAPTEKLLGWLDELHQTGVAVVELTGGEPTSHPDFAAILRTCTAMFELTAVISNGTLWTDEMIAVASEAGDAMFAQIDLDGATAESHDYLRGKGVFDKATKTITRLSEAGVMCKVAMSVHGRNASEIVETARLAKRLGARWFSFGPVLQMGRGHHTDPLLPRHGQLMLEAKDLLREEMRGFVYFGEKMELDISKPDGNCGAGWRGVALGPDGRVRACVMHDPNHLDFGNLNDVGVHGVLERIPGERIRQIPSPNYEDCAGCQHIAFCGGCSARAIQANEFHRAKDDGFTCAWNEKYHALDAYAPRLLDREPASSLKHLV